MSDHNLIRFNKLLKEIDDKSVILSQLHKEIVDQTSEFNHQRMTVETQIATFKIQKKILEEVDLNAIGGSSHQELFDSIQQQIDQFNVASEANNSQDTESAKIFEQIKLFLNETKNNLLNCFAFIKQNPKMFIGTVITGFILGIIAKINANLQELALKYVKLIAKLACAPICENMNKHHTTLKSTKMGKACCEFLTNNKDNIKFVAKQAGPTVGLIAAAGIVGYTIGYVGNFKKTEDAVFFGAVGGGVTYGIGAIGLVFMFGWNPLGWVVVAGLACSVIAGGVGSYYGNSHSRA